MDNSRRISIVVVALLKANTLLNIVCTVPEEGTNYHMNMDDWFT